jgi:hypothetical protein
MTQTAPDRTEIAKQRLQAEIHKGLPQQQELIRKVDAMVIRDRLVPPGSVTFHANEDTLTLHARYQAGEDVSVHKHALEQLARKVDFPLTYSTRLTTSDLWRRDLLAYNLNELYGNQTFVDRKGNPAKFLHRLVGTELRGFLSRSYNRHVASAPLLRSFLGACKEVGAEPVSAFASEVKMGLTCFINEIFEPLPGEYVAVGTSWTNSDFGRGKGRVCLTMMRIMSGTTQILEESWSRVHLGSLIEETDLEISEETARKEAEAYMAIIREAVLKQLEPEPIDKLMEAIQIAAAKDIPWAQLRGQLARFLYKEEISSVEAVLRAGKESIIDLPPISFGSASGEFLPNGWWASNAVGWIANKIDDPERRHEVQQLAGELLGVKV